MNRITQNGTYYLNVGESYELPDGYIEVTGINNSHEVCARVVEDILDDDGICVIGHKEYSQNLDIDDIKRRIAEAGFAMRVKV